MYNQPAVWHQLLSKLSAVVMTYLRVQSRAGAQALQLFDSWVGSLSPADYEEYVLPHVQAIISALKVEGIPIIYFGTGTAGLLPLMRKAGSDVMGVDWRVRLDEAWATIGYDVAIQGNLDPLVLFAPEKEIERRIRAIFEQAGGGRAISSILAMESCLKRHYKTWILPYPAPVAFRLRLPWTPDEIAIPVLNRPPYFLRSSTVRSTKDRCLPTKPSCQSTRP
jgi:hypothetical protein